MEPRMYHRLLRYVFILLFRQTSRLQLPRSVQVVPQPPPKYYKQALQPHEKTKVSTYDFVASYVPEMTMKGGWKWQMFQVCISSCMFNVFIVFRQQKLTEFHVQYRSILLDWCLINILLMPNDHL